MKILKGYYQNRKILWRKLKISPKTQEKNSKLKEKTQCLGGLVLSQPSQNFKSPVPNRDET